MPAPPHRHPSLITRHEAATILGFTSHSFRQWQLRCRTQIRRWVQEKEAGKNHGYKVALFAIEDVLALREEILASRAGSRYEGPQDAPLPPVGTKVPKGYPGLLDRQEAPAFLGIARRTLREWQRRANKPLRRWKLDASVRPSPVLFAKDDLLALRREMDQFYSVYSGPRDAALPPVGSMVPEGYPGLVTQRQAAEMFGISFSQWMHWQSDGRAPKARWYQNAPYKCKPVLFAIDDLEKMRADLDAFFGPYTGPADAPLPPPHEFVQRGYPGLATRRQAAEVMGVPFTTWLHWERERIVPTRRWEQRTRVGARPVMYAVEDLVALREEMRARELPRPDPDLPGAWRVPIRSHIFDLEVIIDEADLPLVEGKAWNYHEDRHDHSGEVILAFEPQTPLKRILLGLEGREHRIRFVNGNPLDCRRCNLIVQTDSEQARSNRKMRQRAGRECTSRFKGVCWCDERGKWLAQIRADGVHHHLGRFDHEEDAAWAYDEAAVKLFGDAARLNFPDNPRETAIRVLTDSADAAPNRPILPASAAA